MYFRKSKKPLLLTILMLLVLCLFVPASAETADIQEITVPNTPIKGVIQLQKKGSTLSGFNVHQDPFGYTVHTPMYGDGYLEGAVFEVRAVEDIVGKDGTLWFRADEIADVIVTSAEKPAESKPLPLGHYYVTEKTAPEGYTFDNIRYDVLLAAKDHETPVVTVNVFARNDYMPTRICLRKEKEVLTTETDSDGMIRTSLNRVPGESFIFGLYNASPVTWSSGTLDEDTLLATAVSNKQGSITFSGYFPHGKYHIRELSCPDGWQLSEKNITFSITDDYSTGNNELLIEWPEPIVNELIHAEVRVSKTDLTGSNYLPHTLIEIKDSDGKTVLRDYTGDDGYLPAFPAVPGKYTFREVLAPEGYELCTTELSFEINQSGEVEGRTVVADDFTRFSILKTDEYDKPLSGVEFGLFRQDGSLQATEVSDRKGIITFEKIPYGTYYIQETKALTGYLKDRTKVPVTVDGTFVNPTEPIVTLNNHQTRLKIKKTDYNGSALQGAEFGLYDANGKLIMTAVSDIEGMIIFTGVPYGSYTIRELSAPEGFLLNQDVISVTVAEDFTNSEEPAAIVTNQQKKLMYIKSDTSGKPIPGIEFTLYNASTMEAVETAVSDQDGVFIFRNFDYGDWIIREKEAPEGYSRMDDIHLHVGNDWKEPKPVMCVNIPNHYEFVKTDSSGTPLEGIKFRLEDEKGTDLGTFVSDKNGLVEFKNLLPGTYFIRETETLEGYTLSGEVIKLKLDEYYVVPEKPRQFVNYTTIQTGVHLAVTGVMWVGIALMAISGTVWLVRKRRQNNNNSGGKTT